MNTTGGINDTVHVLDWSYVMVAPEPRDVGYDRFVMLLAFDTGLSEPRDLAVYSLEAPGAYHLLATAPGCPHDIPRSLTW